MVFNFFANATESVSWVPNPTNRGTSNILQSCLITTSLCVWTALHLNLKEHDDPTFLRISYQTWRKSGWLMIGLLAPEMVVYTAWYQRSEAKRLRDMYNRRFGLDLPPSKLKRAYKRLFHWQGKKRTRAREDVFVELEAAQNHKQTSATSRHGKIPWTLAQGFYAQMGGFALDTIGAYPEFLPEIRTTIDDIGFGILLSEETHPVPAGFTSQDTTPKNKGTDKRPFSKQQSHPQEQEVGVREQQTNEAESVLAENAPNEEQAVAKAGVESDKSNISDADVETSGYSLYRPLDISQKDLEDKSKGDGLAKALVCLQASWFCVQCLVRVGQALPVTLLEINTFAHSVCALLVYVLWWDKPLDVEQPTYLPVRSVEAVKRWSKIYQNTPTTRVNSYAQGALSKLKRKTHTTQVSTEEEDFVVFKALRPREGFLKEVPSEFKKVMFEAEAVKPDGTTYPGLLICDSGQISDGQWVSWCQYPGRNIPGCISSCYSVYKASGANHWKFLGCNLNKEAVPGTEAVDLNRHCTCKTRVPNWPSLDLRKPWILLLFFLVAFLYGGLHSLAWNALFPSLTQQLLWQISSSIIMGAGVPALICYFLAGEISSGRTDIFGPIYAYRWRVYTFQLSKPILNYRLLGVLGGRRESLTHEIREQRGENDTSPLPVIWKELPRLYDFIDELLIWIIVLILPAYLFARIYLVVESFIQLFHLEPGPAFEQPHWSSYIPHFG